MILQLCVDIWDRVFILMALASSAKN